MLLHKVLLIEDDEVVRKQLAKYIQKERFDVIQAADGHTGIELFRSEKPDIVLTDMKIPGIDGMEVITTIKRLSPDTDVILFTGYGETDTAVMALREGVLDYLKKPIDLEALSMTLGRARERVVARDEHFVQPIILLVEDEELPRKRLARVLAKENWMVIEAENGEDAVRTFGLAKIDIVITDITMPVMNGLVALHKMREMNRDFEAIVFTGYGDEESAIQALRDGAINFIKKPVDIDQLLMSVEKALEKLRLDRALKYRNRELELARQIIAQVTAEQEIIINLHNSVLKQATDFAQRLLDAIPTSIMVIKRDFNIVYVNKSLSSILGGRCDKLDEHMIESMKKMGVNELTLPQLTGTMDRLYEAPGNIEIMKTGDYSSLTLTLITIVGDVRDSYVLIAVRGERSV
ncbi:response regulator [Candidatus Magnetominusculus dajiuhuensis]|uniref:response regulator n=1 Tax=Candidatus Magnetominusculus dajiuhuensis TaxID=3137712 RepID=UPI003B43ACF8